MMDDSSVRFEYAEPDMNKETSSGPADSGGMTADALLYRAALRFPAKLAYADPPNRAAFGLGDARRFTFSQADAAANTIAARFAQAGLRAGDKVALRLPNIVELPLVIAGAWRAGLLPICLPMMWRLDELHHALPRIDPAAIVTAGRFGDHNHSATMREASAHHIAIRHIFGTGPGLADGVVPIDDWFSATPQETEQESAQMPAAEDKPAAMTWAASIRGPFPVPRTHKELVAVGAFAAGELSLTDGDVMLATYPMTSIACLGGQMVAALHAGASLILHQPFGYDTFLAQLREFGVTYTAVPGAVIEAMRDRGDMEGGGIALTRIGRISPWPHLAARRQAETGGPLPVYDIHNIGELALIIERAPAAPGLPLGKLRLADGTPCLETRVRGSVSGEGGENRQLSGALLLRGAIVPSGPLDGAGALAEDMLRSDAQGFLNSHFHCTVVETSAGRFVCERDPVLIYHGGVAMCVEELDAAYASFPGILDAAALAIEDELMGDRIFAAVVPRPDQSPSLKNLKLFLAGKGLAAYKAPDQLVIVKAIPRSEDGRVMRERILAQV